MKRNEIMNSFLSKLNPFYDIMNIFLTLFTLGFLVSNLLSGFDLVYIILTIGIVLVGSLLFVMRHHINIKIKIRITLLVFVIFFMHSLIKNGFIGSGIFAFCIYIIMAISYFDLKKSIVFSSIGIILLASVAVMINQGVIDLSMHLKSVEAYKSEWYNQVLTAFSFIVVSYITISVIREHLINTLLENETAKEVLENQKNALSHYQEELEKIAYYDQLTGLFNRQYLRSILDHRKGIPLEDFYMIAILDIVNFKLINANYGMESGDTFLKSIAEIIQTNLPVGGILSRIGANEFALIMPKWTYEDLRVFSEHCYEAFESVKNMVSILPKQPYVIAYHNWYPEENTIDEMIKLLSIAINYAKENHLNGLVAYREEMKEQVNRQGLLLSNVERSIADDAFQVWFQGKWSSKENKFVGYEALSRWFDQEHKVISPGEFIPIINNSQYMKIFNQYIIRKSIVSFESIQKVSKNRLSLSLNISPLFFLLDDFEVFINSVIESSTLDKNQIVLEITEDVFIEDYLPISDKVDVLSKDGFKISLDDFGSGYSSLSHINSIKMDEIKVDRSIIVNLETSDKSQLLIELVIEMAKRLGISVVAEGVETKIQADLLTAIGIDIIQGYYYSKPQPAEKLITDLTEM
ncbi:MAG: EAL domain-containing protein [Clostridia bacterium]|nr:EAL domain-containing protein [Clostridia bacterium]